MPRTKLKEEERVLRRQNTFRTYRKKITSICFHFNKEEDRDVIEWLKTRPVMIDYVRQIIREDMERNK